MREAVRIVYGATTLDFSVDEVLDVSLPTKQDYQTHVRQDAQPAMMYIGQSVASLQITFDLQSMTTVDKIDQFINAGEELTIYYAMQNDATAHLHVVPLIDGIEEVETHGMVEAISRTISFLKSGL